jgi:hypothetical protein
MYRNFCTNASVSYCSRMSIGPGFFTFTIKASKSFPTLKLPILSSSAIAEIKR